MAHKYNQLENTESGMNSYTQNDVPMLNVGYGNQATTMVQIQNPQFEVEQKFGWCHFVMSIITFLIGGLCCLNPVICVFSVLGMVYSGNAYSSHGDKAWGRSRNQNSVAKVFWIISLVFTILTVVVGIIVIVVVVKMFKTAESASMEALNNMYNRN